MTNQEILGHIDHTLLKAPSTWTQIKVLCEEAITYKTASVCVPPSFVKAIHETYGDKLTICTVIGFPLGYNTTAVKVFEAKEAVKEGAEEIDMVINIGDLKDKKYDALETEISSIKKVIGGKLLKVIVETCYLTEDEKIKICQIITSAGADFIKTSTGFGSGGATLEDIKLFKTNIGKNIKIKAAGGIKKIENLKLFLNEGCERIGTSSAVEMLKSKQAGDH
ncbi:MAG: deoxyribose-phosphate aldolase [Eubacterium sp.]